MECYVHIDKPAVAYCRACGRALCEQCRRTERGTVFCAEHVPAEAPVRLDAAPGHEAARASPGLAFLLGLIPGVGAIYNGQYVKGLVHVIVFGTLVSIVNSGAAAGFEPLFGMLIAVVYFYMPFEAYHTARRRQRGEPVDEFSSFMPVKTQVSGLPMGPVVLIAVGAVFLLNTLDIIEIRAVLRWWPAFLIALGCYLLYARLSGGGRNGESPHER